MWYVIFEGLHEYGPVRALNEFKSQEAAADAFKELVNQLRFLDVEVFAGETFDQDRKVATGQMDGYAGPIAVEMFFEETSG